MAVAKLGAPNCTKCGYVQGAGNDCATGTSGPHQEIKFTNDTCLNGRTILAGQKIVLPTAVVNSLPCPYTVTNASA